MIPLPVQGRGNHLYIPIERENLVFKELIPGDDEIRSFDHLSESPIPGGRNRILSCRVSIHDRVIEIIDNLLGFPPQEREPRLAEPLSLEKDQIVLGKAIEKSEVLLHRPWIEAHRDLHPFGLKVRKVLKDPITAGCDLIALDEKENLHLISLSWLSPAEPEETSQK
jgi:hypothetical protein